MWSEEKIDVESNLKLNEVKAVTFCCIITILNHPFISAAILPLLKNQLLCIFFEKELYAVNLLKTCNGLC